MSVSRDRGFTLIELVVVIIILGILAVTAAPKFINMQDDAQEAALRGQFAAFESAVKLYHSGWLAAGHTGAVRKLKTFGEGNVSSTSAGWPFGEDRVHTPGDESQMYPACLELWTALTETDLTIAYADSENPAASLSEDIGLTYNDSTCKYISTYFSKKGDEFTLHYDNMTGEVTINTNFN